MRTTMTVLTSVITSTVVSAIIAAVLKYTSDRRILQLTHRNQMQLQRSAEYRKMLYDAVMEHSRQRREKLPRVMEAVYRFRNTVRDTKRAEESVSQKLRDQLRKDAHAVVFVHVHTTTFLYIEGLGELVHKIKDLAEVVVWDGDEAVIRDIDAYYTQLDSLYQQLRHAVTDRLKPPYEELDIARSSDD
jgi:hypothetical protein